MSKRLSNKQDSKTKRQEFFNLIISDNGYECLEIDWAITFDFDSQIIPQKAEADLVQLYFEENGCLPKYNKKY